MVRKCKQKGQFVHGLPSSAAGSVAVIEALYDWNSTYQHGISNAKDEWLYFD